MIGLIPWRLVGWLALAVALFGAGFATEHKRRNGIDAENALAQARQIAEAAQEAQRITARLGAKSQKVQDDYATQARKERAAADRSRDAAGRLYDDLAAAQRAADDADSACPTDAEATALRQLFGTCSGRYRDVAAEAGSYAGQLAALQQWTGSICAPAVAPEGTRGDR